MILSLGHGWCGGAFDRNGFDGGGAEGAYGGNRETIVMGSWFLQDIIRVLDKMGMS